MQELKDRIVKEGKILPGNIVKVDGFLNHRVDCAFMGRIADEFQKFFDLDKVDLILTAEASGIALSAICAYRYGKPMVYAKKAKSDNIEGGLYQSEIFSYTYKKKVTLLVSKEWIHPGDRVLVIDDFLARGEALRGLCVFRDDCVGMVRRMCGNMGDCLVRAGNGLDGKNIIQKFRVFKKKEIFAIQKIQSDRPVPHLFEVQNTGYCPQQNNILSVLSHNRSHDLPPHSLPLQTPVP